jgi:hypothetical protein
MYMDDTMLVGTSNQARLNVRLFQRLAAPASGHHMMEGIVNDRARSLVTLALGLVVARRHRVKLSRQGPFPKSPGRDAVYSTVHGGSARRRHRMYDR